jgi:FAD/FMN-containing dehydrogenase
VSLRAPTPEVLARFKSIVGGSGAITNPLEMGRYLTEWRDLYHGKTPIVLRPKSTAEVAAILALAEEERIGVVPQGGNTGLVGGQIPFESGSEIVISLERMSAIRAVDASGNTLIAEAGATLKSIQDAAAEHGRLFPLSLASEGTCQIGGNLATNAGGIHVLRYGNTRELTLGVEAVFAGGKVWNGLKTLRKDNSGYDLKDLLIGSEGTLGIITAAALRLFPQPAETVTVIAGLPSLGAASSVFEQFFTSAGPLLTAFELMPRILIDFLLKHMAQTRDPLPDAHPWYALIEITSPTADEMAQAITMAVLESALDQGIVADAAIAASESQRHDFWRLRESMSEVQKFEGGSIKHDISVPVSQIERFITEACAVVERLVPGARPVPFGHYGDGNIHFNVSQPIGMDKAAFLARWDYVAEAVHGVALSLGGSISAEHGIGRLKAESVEKFKSSVELDLMRAIKTALDPHGIMNPGKLLRGTGPNQGTPSPQMAD